MDEKEIPPEIRAYFDALYAEHDASPEVRELMDAVLPSLLKGFGDVVAASTAHEREECAKLAESMLTATADHVAAAIRARK